MTVSTATTPVRPDPTPAWPPVDGLPTLQAGDRVHLVGVGGAGMSGLAHVLAARGLAVSGSDQRDGPRLAALRAAGVRVVVGHDAALLPEGCRLVVRSPAVPDENPELVAAHAAGVPVTKRAPLLGALLDAGTGVAVAGTHGKTTTSGLVAALLVAAGRDPTFFVGGEVHDLGTNARAGDGPLVVIEADEYDRSFLHGHPTLAAITHLEHDHPDIYPDLEAVIDAFRAFVARVRPTGRLVVNAAVAAVAHVVDAARAPVEGYHVAGDPVPPPGMPVRWRATDLSAGPDGQQLTVWHDDARWGTVTLALPGRHNVANALAAVALAEALEVPPAVTRDVIARYRGAARRFDVLGTAAGVTVVDDYAHHPTEVAATLEAARGRYPGRRLLAVWQPHTYSRTAALADAFATALAGADRVVITPVYAAREPAQPVDLAAIAGALPSAELTASVADAANAAAAAAGPGDVVLFLGAGDITTGSRTCLAALQASARETLRSRAAAEGLGGDVLTDEPLAKHTSLRVGGPADLAVRVRHIADLVGWLRLAGTLGVPTRVLGRGTNVLAGAGGLKGLVVLNRCEQWSLHPTADGTRAHVVAESGVTLAALATQLARAGWAGLEAGVGIPGSVGAGVVTNAGAHGWSMADSTLEAEVLEPDGTIRTWSRDELRFRYRGSALKGDPRRVVLRARLAVTHEPPAEIAGRIAGYTAHRRQTQPTTPSVGSMFKNPPGDYAGRLIEAAGLKGLRVGGAEVSPTHANFFVNRGGASAADFSALVERVRETVRRRFEITLELEIEPLDAKEAPDVR